MVTHEHDARTFATRQVTLVDGLVAEDDRPGAGHPEPSEVRP
jgi:hypothetical protein